MNTYWWILSIVLSVSLLAWGVATWLLVRERQKNIVIEPKHYSQGRKRPYAKWVTYPLIGTYLKRIRKHVEMVTLSDEATIQKKAWQMAKLTLGSTGIILLILVSLNQSLTFLVIAVFTVIMIHEQILTHLVERLEHRLLRQFSDFLTEVRHHYNEHRMVDEAVYDAVDQLPYEMSLHAQKMYEVLMDEAGDVEDYYETAPNQYFKSFVALCYTVLQFGDQKVEDASGFLKNLNYLKQEVGMDLLKREKLNYLLSSLTLISVLPIFLIHPLMSWATNSMPDLVVYYKGAYGFVSQMVLFLLVFLAYQLIIRMRRHTVVYQSFRKGREMGWVEKRLSPFLKRYITVHYSQAKQLDRKLRNCGVGKGVERFYMDRLLCGILVALVCLFVIINVQQMNKKHLIMPLYVSEFEDPERVLFQAEVDREIIGLYDVDQTEAIEALLAKRYETDDPAALDLQMARVIPKIQQYKRYQFRWYHVLIALVAGYGGSLMPSLLLAFRAGVMQMHMEEEVLQFQAIILMLMPIERIAVGDLLSWMRLFAVIFKEDIDECLNDYELGDIEALEALKERVVFGPFVKIIDNLQATADKITIAEAFDELLVERGYYQEKRRQDTEILIAKKGSWGKVVAFIPMSASILGFLLIPFTHLGLSQFGTYMTQITG